MEGRTLDPHYDFSDEEDSEKLTHDSNKYYARKRPHDKGNDSTVDHDNTSDIADNENDDIHNTEPYSMESFDSLENVISTSGDEIEIDTVSPKRRKINLNGTGATQTKLNDSKESLKRVVSVAQDADNIAAMLGIKTVDHVYERVKQLRNRNNRSDIVTNEILEGRLKMPKDDPQDIVAAEAEDDPDLNILEDVKIVRDSVLGVYPNAMLDNEQILLLLEKYHQKRDYIDYVRDLLLRQIVRQNQIETQPTDFDIHSHEIRGLEEPFSPSYLDEDDRMTFDLEQILSEFPRADPHQVFKLLSKYSDSNSRVLKVLEILQNEDHGHLDSDPLYRDTNKIAALFPNRDKNEIYAYLEAHYHTHNRVQIVTDELLRLEQANVEDRRSQNIRDDIEEGYVRTKHTNHGKKTIVGSPAQTNNSASNYSTEQQEKEVEMMLAVFPDCDPEYLFEQLDTMPDDPDRVQRLSNHMFENNNYPKLRDRLAKEDTEKRRFKLQNQAFVMVEFIRVFPKPSEVFLKISKGLSKEYKQHCHIQLRNDFPFMSEDCIKNALEECHDQYLITKKHLCETRPTVEKKGTLLNEAREPQPLPYIPDEFFYMELLYAKHEKEIEDYIKVAQEELKKRREELDGKEEAYYCPCCYSPYVFEEMLACPEGHLSCRDCVRGQANTAMGMARLRFPCLECYETQYSLSTLKEVLEPKIFSLLLRRIQEDEVRQAGLDDVVHCPFCSFATIMPDPDDKVLKCLNPECFKETCRLCKELNHVPLGCDELKKPTDLRTYVESKMTESIIRYCWRCSKAFFKIEGCNQMTCSCGASMCYICRMPVRQYSHFNDQSCPLDSDVFDLHRNEMEKAALEAKEQWLKKNPTLSGQAEDFDPLDMVRMKVIKVPKPKPAPQPRRSPRLLGIIPIPALFGGRTQPPVEPDPQEEEEYQEIEVNPLEEYYENHADSDPEASEPEDDIEDEEFEKALKEYENRNARNEDEKNVTAGK